jgi:hypothetical protein
MLLRWFLHHLRVCIFTVDQDQFDLRALVHPIGLYKQALPPLLEGKLLSQGAKELD